ncbi:hydrolase [Bacillus kexueae]|uniref:hydrolase n=1 Tax=Aeribacillus kexueae TaxID=2078952 RepID=UPI001FAF396D|nr:hydrolase [Bacillus kexueae]
MEKKTYYISVASGEISRVSTASPWDFQIKATDEEITTLREYFDQIHSTGWQNFFRAHVPYVGYHYDRENDAIDSLNKKVYELIYELGNEEARQHIQSSGILESIKDPE